MSSGSNRQKSLRRFAIIFCVYGIINMAIWGVVNEFLHISYNMVREYSLYTNVNFSDTIFEVSIIAIAIFWICNSSLIIIGSMLFRRDY